jgi:hypothetical protein
MSQPSPPSSRCCASPARKPRSMRLSSSYTACSMADTGRAGSQGGLHTTRGARPGGNRSACNNSTRSCRPRRCRLSCAQASARGRQFGGHHAAHASACQHGRQHAGAGTDVKRQCLAGQGLARHQVQVLPTHGREHPVVRMDTVVRRDAQRGNLHALLAPFMRAHDAQQLTQRHHAGRAIGRAPGLGTGHAPVGRTAQGDAVVPLQRNEQRAQRACALRLRLAVQVKARGGIGLRCLGGGAGCGRCWLAFDTALQGLQELARVLEVAPPQQCRALTGQAVGLVSAQAVVGDLHAARRSCALGRTPVQRVRLALLGPCDGHFNSAGAASALLRAWHHR